MKTGLRAIGIDDGPQSSNTILVGVVMRPDRLEGVLTAHVKLDGDDATKIIIKMVKGRFEPQIKCIFLNGVAVAGFNIVNYQELSEVLSLPVIVCTPNKPHPDEFSKALGRWPRKQELWEQIKTPAYRLDSIWYQFAGCNQQDAKLFIKQFQVHAAVPEPLRIAHLVATGIELGESKGS